MTYDSLIEMYNKWENRVQNYGREGAPFSIAFCGVFSSGKSSLINAVLGSGDILPTGINPVTKIITRIRYGCQISHYYVAEGQTVTVSKQVMDELITGSRDLPDNCTELILETPSPILQNNIEFIDTPGYEDNSELEDLSREAVLTADMIVFCCNATMLGKQFEKEYLDELKQSHGSFCMIVNRMDCLNTDDDFEDVKCTAQRLMQGRGNASNPYNQSGNYFLTVAAGQYKTLNGFDEYLTSILLDTQKRDLIRRTTNYFHTAFQLKRFEEGKAVWSVELENLKKEDSAKKEKVQIARNAEIASLENKHEQSKIYVSSLIKSHKTSIEGYLRNLSSPYSFCKDAAMIVRNNMENLVNSIVRHSSDQGFFVEDSLRDCLSVYKACSIPEPTYHWEKRRGFFGQIAESLINWELDDGYDKVWDDYRTPGIEAVSNHLDSLNRTWASWLDNVKEDRVKKPLDFSPNPHIADLQSMYDNLQTLENKLKSQEKSYYLSTLQDNPDSLTNYLIDQTKQFRNNSTKLFYSVLASLFVGLKLDNWGTGSIKVLIEGGLGSGRTSLINELTGTKLPTRIVDSNPVIKIISNQKAEKACIYNNQAKETTTITLDEFYQAYGQNKYSSEDEITIYSKHPGFGTQMISVITNSLDSVYSGRPDIQLKTRSEAKAIIRVIDARMALTEEIHNYFNSLRPDEIEKLFVVVNRIDCINDHDIPSLTKAIRSYFSHIYVDHNKNFDEDLFASRVFYVDSFNTNTFEGISNESIESTDIPDLQLAIKQYVYNPDQIKSSYLPIFNSMCSLYSKLQKNGGLLVIKNIKQGKENLDNICFVLYGKPATAEIIKAHASQKQP